MNQYNWISISCFVANVVSVHNHTHTQRILKEITIIVHILTTYIVVALVVINSVNILINCTIVCWINALFANLCTLKETFWFLSILFLRLGRLQTCKSFPLIFYTFEKPKKKHHISTTWLWFRNRTILVLKI